MMSITQPDPRAQRARRMTGLAAALTLLLAPALAGCTGGSVSPTPPDGPRAGVATADVVPLMQQVLRRRARALKRGDEQAFLATVSPSRETFVDRERVYFANLAQLPVDRLSYRVAEDSMVRTEGGYDAVVDVHLQLAGFDALPVVRPARFRFVDDPRGEGLLVASDRDRAWEQRNDVDVAPWDRGAITVVTGSGVLGIFDAESVRVAPDVIGHIEDGIGQVSQLVPYEWNANVVVYALSDTSLLDALDDLPADDPNTLDAVSFPVPVRIDSDKSAPLAGTRFLLHPRMLGSDPQQLARLIRHELTHVALGSLDDDVPTWLGEGIAEWVSVQPLPASQRLISQAAIDAARAGLADLPDDLDYHDEDQAAHYGVSWWACEAIVDLYGEAMLWRLLDELAATSPSDQADELQQTLQMGSAQVAREAAKRIIATYA